MVRGYGPFPEIFAENFGKKEKTDEQTQRTQNVLEIMKKKTRETRKHQQSRSDKNFLYIS